MALTKPDKSQASLHKRKAEKDGASIRSAALDNISDSDSDDYTLGKFPRSVNNATTRATSPRSEEIEYVTGINDFFRDDGDENLENYYEEEREREQQVDHSWLDDITTSSQNQYSFPVDEDSPQVNLRKVHFSLYLT